MSAPAGIPEHLFVAIDHVGIAVPDLDDAIASYRENFGMDVVHQEVNEEQGVREAMVAVGDPAIRRVRASSCSPRSNEDSTIAKFLDRSGPGLQQLAFRVTDVEEVSRVLRERGLRLLYDAPQAGYGGLADQLHPPQGRRRRARRAGGARRRPLARAFRRHADRSPGFTPATRPDGP